MWSSDTLFVFNVVSITSTLFAFLAIAAIVQAVTYQRRFRDRELDALRLRAQLTAARLESLRAKLHPHFLFNTLNGISDLIFTDPHKADALVLRLAQLLRASLDTVDDEISVRQELEMLTAYFDIERMRFGDRLRVTIDADRAAFDARVPPFLVQPLAENAIQHGIAPRASGGAVTLRAHVREGATDHRLVLELSDDGVGMPDDVREGDRPPHNAAAPADALPRRWLRSPSRRAPEEVPWPPSSSRSRAPPHDAARRHRRR